MFTCGRSGTFGVDGLDLLRFAGYSHGLTLRIDTGNCPTCGGYFCFRPGPSTSATPPPGARGRIGGLRVRAGCVRPRSSSAPPPAGVSCRGPAPRLGVSSAGAASPPLLGGGGISPSGSSSPPGRKRQMRHRRTDVWVRHHRDLAPTTCEDWIAAVSRQESAASGHWWTLCSDRGLGDHDPTRLPRVVPTCTAFALACHRRFSPY